MARISSRRGNSPAIPVSHNHRDRRSEKEKPNTRHIRVGVAGFKPHPNPYGEEHGQQYSFKMLANGSLPEALGSDFLKRWMKVNPREQNLTGPIMKSIAETWDEKPTEFFRVNRG